MSGSPVRDEDGQIAGGVLVVRDLTERWRLEHRTHEALNALLAMAEALVLIPDDEADGRPHSAATRRVMARRLAGLTRTVLGCRRVSIAAVDPREPSVQPLAAAGLLPAEERAWWTLFEQHRSPAGPLPRPPDGLAGAHQVTIM